MAGAVLAGASPADEAAIDAYGEALGLAFQIVDDILDVEGASADLGKTAGKDAAAGKPTYPAVFGLDESRRLAAECADRALSALSSVALGGQASHRRLGHRPHQLKKTLRLDTLLVERGLAASRERARALILAGQVRVDGQPAGKAGTPVGVDAAVTLVEPDDPYVGRGGLKLEHALSAFGIAVEGRLALDIGASTGGFTDVLLRHGAARVVALDVGHGQLDWRLRSDPRVISSRKSTPER